MSFFFFYLGYDSHDAAREVADAFKRKRKEEEEILAYLLKREQGKPKAFKKSTLKATLLRNFKGQEVKKVIEVIAQPQVKSLKDLIKSYEKVIAAKNRKRQQILMAIVLIDEDD